MNEGQLIIRERIFDWGKKTYLMGILNITPDSFSDGGKFNNLESATEQAQIMLENGVDIIDIGGESTRPGSKKISLEEEIKRVIPVIKKLRELTSIPISIDTTKAQVAQEAIAAGADIINDISGGTAALVVSIEMGIEDIARIWRITGITRCNSVSKATSAAPGRVD